MRGSGTSTPASGAVTADAFRAFPAGRSPMSPVRKLVDGGICAALQYAAPVARRLRSALSEDLRDQRDQQAEREVTALRRELDETRAALRLQTARCRQLVAAYSARLRAGNALRDHQLTLVLRALVALEARLRREQKAIRAQLAQRDAIIHQQQVEISRLRAAQPPSAQPQHPPHPPSAHGAPQHSPAHAPASRSASSSSTVTPSQLIVENHTCGQDSSCDQDQRDQRRAQGRTHETVVDAMSHLRHQEAALRVLELVGPGPPATTTLPLLNGETACIVEPPADFIEDVGAVTPPPDVVASYNDMNRECLELASMAASLRGVGDKGSCYQDNPVLECVNLILLRDQEDFQEERRGRERGQQARARGTGRGRRSVEEPEPQLADLSSPSAWYNGGPPMPLTRPPRPTPPALPPKPPRLVGQRPAPPRNSKSPTPASTPTSAPTTPTTPTSTTPSMQDKASPPPSPPAADEREDGSEALRRNFEEFNLDDCDIAGLGQAEPDSPAGPAVEAKVDSDGRPRPEGDGAESGRLQGLLLTAPAEAPGGVPLGLPPGLPQGLTPQDLGLSPALAGTLAQQLAQLAPANYDSFLEATGLSNKSILTPSRMLSNHRSVLKPKDVKHRSRVKAGERCALPSGMPTGGPTVKYWTEPFL